MQHSCLLAAHQKPQSRTHAVAYEEATTSASRTEECETYQNHLGVVGKWTGDVHVTRGCNGVAWKHHACWRRCQCLTVDHSWQAGIGRHDNIVRSSSDIEGHHKRKPTCQHHLVSYFHITPDCHFLLCMWCVKVTKWIPKCKGKVDVLSCINSAQCEVHCVGLWH